MQKNLKIAYLTVQNNLKIAYLTMQKQSYDYTLKLETVFLIARYIEYATKVEIAL